MNEKPLSCWIILKLSGEVCCAHCDCMAGLGEACSHIAAILYYLEALARMEGMRTCTQEECQWIIPSYLKKVEYLPIKEINFTSAKGKKRKLDEMIDGNSNERPLPKVAPQGKRSTETELALLFDELSCGGTKPGVLSLTSDHSAVYVPKLMCDGFPQPLTSLKQPQYVQMNYLELLEQCDSVTCTLDISGEMAAKVEQATRSQSSSKLWFKYRAGCITASRIKAVCRTNPGNPAQSLIKTICYPEAFSFTCPATKWGCKHEKDARDMYLSASKVKHSELTVTDSGLVINSKWPHIGASPDGIINCNCHGKGVLEIKCPYCHRGTDIQSASDDRKFCLKKVNGKLFLDHAHAYYYQVQCQLHVCDVSYADICVCTFAMDDDQGAGIHIERIFKDTSVWNECKVASEQFFKTCLLPELMGNWYTRSTVTTSNDTTVTTDSASGTSSDNSVSVTLEGADSGFTDQLTYCYCHRPEEGTMIACDNPDCPIEWFHTSCLQLTKLPKGKAKWYCPDCRILPRFLRKKVKK